LQYPGGEDADRFHAEFFLLLGRELGWKIQVLEWKTFFALEDLRGTAVVDLNESTLCADSYPLLLTLTRGGRLLFNPEKAESETVVESSPYHFTYIEESFPSDCAAFSPDKSLRVKALEYFAKHDRRLHYVDRPFPWPKWFEAWSKFVRHEVENAEKL
jgi:hypothetical protein